MRRATPSIVAALLACTPAARAEDSVPVQQFAPATGGATAFLVSHGASVLPHLKPSVGVFLNYAKDPLILRRVSNGEQVELLANQLQLDLIAAVGLGDLFEVGLVIPMTLAQSAGDVGSTLAPRPVSSFASGDLRLVPKFSLLDGSEGGLGLALVVPVTLPTGSPTDLQGNTTPTVEPRLAVAYLVDAHLRVGLNLGFLYRPELQTLYNIDVGNELTAGAAAEYRFDRQSFGAFSLLFDVWGRVSLEPGTQGEERPVEAALATRYSPEEHHGVTLGVSRGVTKGYGSPDFRVFAGYAYTPIGDLDPDGDDLLGSSDACPSEPEDVDRFEDLDGCPDRDNDMDGIPDPADACPDVREDYDGFQDADGCPEADNDGDGLLDASDRCPESAEDLDRIDDGDGCPDADDPDPDKDGLCDPWVPERGLADTHAAVCGGSDACPREPEDKDGFQDEDGCPDPDNDGDGLLDLEDACPDQPGQDCRARLIGKCEIQILDQIYFRYDRDIINEERSAPVLNAVAEVMRQHPWILRLEVQGHTDSDGPAGYNKHLSQRRSEAVRRYLVERGGIAPDRLVGRGYGEFRPLMTNDNPAGRATNRRVQFVIIDPSREDCRKR